MFVKVIVKKQVPPFLFGHRVVTKLMVIFC